MRTITKQSLQYFEKKIVLKKKDNNLKNCKYCKYCFLVCLSAKIFFFKL